MNLEPKIRGTQEGSLLHCTALPPLPSSPSPSERDYPFHLVRTPLISPARFNSQNAPGRLAVYASFLPFSSLLVAISLSFTPSIHTWLHDLFYLSAGGNTNPSVSFTSSSSLMVFYKFTWQTTAPYSWDSRLHACA